MGWDNSYKQMKELKLTLLAFIVTVGTLCGQVITETVDFDTYVSASDNDFSNNFTFGDWADTNFLSQSSYGGITGGCLELVSSSNGMNDKIDYKSTMKNAMDTIIEVSIAFKYDTTMVNPNAKETPLSIHLISPSNTSMRFIIYKGSSLYVIAGSHVSNNPLPTALESGNWYKYLVQYTPIGGSFGDEFHINIKLTNLGEDGISANEIIAEYDETIYGIGVVEAQEWKANILASKRGGVEYLDNFMFKGVKGTDLFASVENQEPVIKAEIWAHGNTIFITGEGSARIYNTMGQMAHQENLSPGTHQISLRSGMYLVEIEGATKKVFLSK